MSTESSEEKKELIRFAVFCFLICLLWCVAYLVRLAPELADSDCYMRLNRVQSLYEGRGWYETRSFRSNAPYGETLHWTRPFDILLLGGAIPGSAFVDFRTALFWWGVIISPVLLFGMLMAMLWATRPMLSRQGPFLLGILLFFQVIVITYYRPGRCDHHSLLILLFVVLFGFGLRFVSRPVNPWVCCAAGAVGGLSMWVSVESMLTVFAIAAILGLLWIWENGDFAKKSVFYGGSLFVAIGISLLLERPWGDLAAQEFDRLSIVHWSMCGFLAALWVIVGLIGRFSGLFGRRIARLMFFVGGIGLTMVCVWFLFPKFYAGPFADIDPRIVGIWLSRVNEVQPMFSKGGSIWASVQFAGTAIISVGFLFYLLWSRNCRDKKSWGYVFILLLIFILPSIYQIRWMSYSQFLVMLPVAELMDRVLKMLEGHRPGIVRVLKNVSVILVFSATFFVVGLAAEWIAENKEIRGQGKKVSLVKICRYLNEDEKWRGRNMRILADIDSGPEILYRTGCEVIGTPYHRNWRGILDTYDIMTAGTDETAQKLIEQRKIELVLLCLNSPKFGNDLKQGEKSTFYQRLSRNECPNWLKMVELPDGLSASFKLFEVIRN
jgi:hypothetical protein